MLLSFFITKPTLKSPVLIACLAFFMSLPLSSIAQNLAQNQNPLQNPLSKPTQTKALDSLQPQKTNLTPNPFKDFGEIDSSILQSYSTFTPRYNTRFDTKHNLNLNAFGGQINIDSTQNQYKNQNHINQTYGGLNLSYDNLIERYGVGAFISYVYNDATSKSARLAKAHTGIVGAYLDFFIDSHHIKARLAQSFNFLDFDSIKGIISSTTNFEASYGFVFPLKTKGSFIEPFSKFSIASLFNIEKKDLDLSNYALHSHIELGAHFRQFIGNENAYFYITPSFVQTIGIDKKDPLLRVININEYGQAQIMMNDNLYRSYGLLLVGIDFKLRHSVRLFLQANGKIAQNLYSYGGNLGLNIAF
ncbi:hypothetical protein [Helicobacter sp. T3_23-1059]